MVVVITFFVPAPASHRGWLLVRGVRANQPSVFHDRNGLWSTVY